MSLLAQINNAAHTGAFGHNPRSEPTLAQLAAGNYKKGVVMVKGLSIAIENPAYTYRKGMDKTGQQWMCLMQAHYGYIQGYKGNDGDDMDVFIGVAPENDTVYIVNQKTADGYFDEHKIMLGFLSQQQAVDTYQHCFERGWTGLMSVVPCTMTQFKWWLANGNKSRPVTLDRLPYAGLERLDSVNWGGTDGSNLYSHDGQVHKLLYQIRQCDDTHQALEPLAYHDMIAELGNQGFMYENYDALIVEYNKLEKKAKQLLMVMQGAADTVKPVGVTVSKPLTKGGVANVVAWFEMDDGQAVGVFFHNPDKTPKKINPTDEMISYKWVLNKKDITIAVAPEQGKDLVIRTVAKRIMQLVEKNHERFVKANGDKAELNQKEQSLGQLVIEKQSQLDALNDDVKALEGRKAEKEALAIQAQAEADRHPNDVLVDPIIKQTYADKTGQTVYAELVKNREGSVWILKSTFYAGPGTGVFKPFGAVTQGYDFIKRFETKEDAEKWAVENGYKVAGKETPKHLKDIIFSWDGNAEQQKLKSILANNPNLIQAYNQYFNENLQGKSVMTSIGKVWTTGETRTEMRNRLTKFKAMIIPYVPEILIHGKVGTEKANKDATEPKKAKYESFIPFQHSVTIDGLEVLAMVQVGKMKSDGKLAYSLNVNQNQEVFDSMDEKAIFSPSQVVQEDQQGYRAVKNSLDSITAQDDGEINIEILSVYDRRTGKSLTENEAEKLLFGEQAVELAINGKSTLSANQQPEPVTLTGKELGDFADTPEGKKALRAAAKAEFEKLLGQWVDCPALNSLEGENTKVEIRKRGIKEFMAFSGNPKKLKLVAEIANIIKTAKATPNSWQPNSKADKKRSADGYYHLANSVNVDSETLNVTVIIEKDNNGLLHYDVLVPSSIADDLDAKKMSKQPVPDNYSGGDLDTEASKPTYDSILDSGAWVVNLFIEGEPLEVLEEETTPNPDRDYLQSIIDGKADLEAKGITTKIRQIILTAKDASDTDMLELADKAARAYATYVKAKAVAKLAEVQ